MTFRISYPHAGTIAVDVNDTLGVQGQPNERLAQWIGERRREGYSVMLWSARGETYAREVAAALGITDLFDVIAAKPGYIVNDRGWGWIRFAHVAEQRDNHTLVAAVYDDTPSSAD